MKLKKRIKLIKPYELNISILDKKNKMITVEWAGVTYTVYLLTYDEVKEKYCREFVENKAFKPYIDLLVNYEKKECNVQTDDDLEALKTLSLIPELIGFSPFEEDIKDILYKRAEDRFKRLEDEYFNNECLIINGDITISDEFYFVKV